MQKETCCDKLTVNMAKKLWQFIDKEGTFSSDTADKIKTLYFPICNSYPLMSSLSPDLHGDIKTGFHAFLLEPVSRQSLVNSRASRNFWIDTHTGNQKRTPEKIWSATGVSKNARQLKKDRFNLQAGLLWHKLTRQNSNIGLKAEITSFVPASGEPVEIMFVRITNVSSKTINFTPTAAIPIFGRSAHNLHDHRQVTSLLQRIDKNKFGVITSPALLFDEAGHKKDTTSYFVLGIDTKNGSPQYIYPTQEQFTGEASDLEAPESIFRGYPPAKKKNNHGKEAMAGLRFKSIRLKKKQNTAYIILMGIVKDKSEINPILKNFNTETKIRDSLKNTQGYWQEKSTRIAAETNDPLFDNWIRWVNIQPALRRIFGCSFLPDFDYGKGGRGWRDLWQDCLSLILDNPKEVKTLLVNNLAGVRIDGSHATIIGNNTGEFIADRNNISRVWMDHGIWPLITIQFYIHQTSDIDILFEETTYFRDYQMHRGLKKDTRWQPQEGNFLQTKSGKIYKGSLLEHILVENLVQFFNVGPHNHIRLEGSDWNDGLDMAPQRGESVAFSAMYAQNLKAICGLLERLNTEKIPIFRELTTLLNSATRENTNYSDVKLKREILDRYLGETEDGVTEKRISLPKEELISSLKEKADWMYGHIRKSEWLKEGFFNGYYNNDGERIEGATGGLMRMTLAGQVFPVMSGIATTEQIKTIFLNTQKYLKDKKTGGFRLNTDFKAEQLNLGRAFSFAYGNKENGAFFNHMCVMFAYALYLRGFVKEGYAVIKSIYRMALDTQKSRIYPCLPEYFNAEGQGMYSYLTGSASWFMLTLLTQVFGIRGEYGDLIIEPKLTAEQLNSSNRLSTTASFAQRPIKVEFFNPRRKDFGRYRICKVSINGKTVAEGIHKENFHISRSYLLSVTNAKDNLIRVTLD
ncbi:MAG: cellobiose phosphorylase [Candidatus Omnitrophota bacterium]